MTTSLGETLAAVPSLNHSDQPFAYAVEGTTVIGTWDIVRATSLYPTEVDHIDEDYAITVSLDEAKGTYDFVEKKTERHAKVSGSGLSFGTSGFKGKSSSKEFSFEFGGLNKSTHDKTEDGVSANPVVYSFATSRIKDPLFDFLGQHGWQPEKKGFFAKLFSH